MCVVCSNLANDKFMQKELKSDDGWLPFATLAKFKRLLTLTTDMTHVAKVLKEHSTLLEVDSAQTKVRRTKPVTDKDHKACTVYAVRLSCGLCVVFWFVYSFVFLFVCCVHRKASLKARPLRVSALSSNLTARYVVCV